MQIALVTAQELGIGNWELLDQFLDRRGFFHKTSRMAAMGLRTVPLRERCWRLATRSGSLRHSSTASTRHNWPVYQTGPDAAKDEVARLAASPRRALTFTDLLR